ncbi:MAG: hypothetical protein NC231_09640 [Bacillus sp. (in: Bacteria)]|nr:hypothetical protein [Bacillus sp. (in: firmicutes)]
MITVWIDEMTPCLKDNLTGELISTEVLRVRRKSFLQKFNKKNGWYVNWAELLKEDSLEIYALVIAGTVDIQGLVALQKSDEMQAVYVAWMCTAPHNNKLLIGEPKYSGVGGHLFAIAANKSVEYNYNGVITGNAANGELLEHYCNTFHADFLGILHPYQMMINEENAAKIMEVYDYEWTDDEL